MAGKIMKRFFSQGTPISSKHYSNTLNVYLLNIQQIIFKTIGLLASRKPILAHINLLGKIGQERSVKNFQGMSAYIRTGHSEERKAKGRVAKRSVPLSAMLGIFISCYYS
jgi:hypothetical protein